MTRLLPGPTIANRGLVLLIAALCTGITVAAAGTGWWLRSSADDMSAAVFGDVGPDQRQLQVTYQEVPDGTLPGSAGDRLDAALPPVVRDVFGPPRPTVLTPDMVPDALPPRPAAPAFLTVVGFPDLDRLVEVVEGRMPRPGSPTRTLPPAVGAAYNESLRGEYPPPRGRASVVEVILEQSASRELEMPVGSWVELSSTAFQGVDTRSAVLHVVGTYRAAAPAPTALDDADSARRPSISRTPEFNLVRASALAADQATVLGATWEAEPDVRWTFDLLGSPRAARADALVEQMRKVELQAMPPVVESAGFLTVSGVGDVAQQVVDERNTSDGVLALVLTALAAAALAVLLAAAVVLAARRREVTTVVRARGASNRWVAGLRGAEALLLCLPGALIALGVLVVVEGSVTLADVAITAAAAGSCALLVTAAQALPQPAAGDRLRLVVRDALQLVLVGLTGAAVVLVFLDDDVASDDPVLLIVPPLLGATASVVLMRLLQGGLGGLRRAVGRTRRPAPVVSLSQASAIARQVVLASAATVLAISSGWLALSVADGLRTGAERAGWEEVGADAAVRTSGFHDDTVERLAGIPGVDEVAAVATTDSVSLDTRTGVEGVQLVATDVDALAEVGEQRLRDLRLPEAPAGELAAVASSDLLLDDERATLRYAQSTIPVRVVDRVDRIPGVTSGGSFLLVDIAALSEIVERRQDSYSTILLQGGADRDRIQEVARSVDPLAVVTTRAAVTGNRLDGPATARTLTMLTVCTAATAGLAVFAVLLMVGLGAPTRRRTGVVMRAVGADLRQVRRVNGLALVPIVVAACAAAAGCGVLLTTIVDHGFDLAALTRTGSALPVRPDPRTALWIAAVLAGLVAMAALAARGRNRSADILDHLDQETR